MTHAKDHLKALESVIEEMGFRVRYERGNFNAGACLLKGQKVIVINKHYSVEG